MSCRIINNTPFQAGVFAWDDVDGRTRQVLVVKGTWRLSTGRLAESDHQLPVFREALEVRLRDLPLEPTQGRMITERENVRWTRFESDHVPGKPRFDVLINAWAQAADGRPRAAIECAVEYNGKTLLDLVAHAPRVWRARLGGLASPVLEPLGLASRIPLVYPFAFGGDPIGGHPSDEPWPANQGGMGYCVRAGAAEGVPLPWIESASHPIRNWDDRPGPIALGHTSAADQPRRALQGTFDEPWQRDRAPLPPVDFDPRHFNAAPVPLQLASPPAAGDRFSLYHLGKQARIDIRLPAVHVQASAETAGGARIPAKTALWDTLLIEPEEDHYVLIWRTSFADDAIAPLHRIAVHAGPEARS